MKICIVLAFLSLPLLLLSQNNYIYNGGKSEGFDFNVAEKAANNGIFSGSSNEGFDHSLNISTATKWNGGTSDGWAFDINNTIENDILYGGIDDGMSYAYFEKASNNMVSIGGIADGFSFLYTTNNASKLVHSGGVGDGFSYCGISKLIWDGDISKDWLMADNWNIPIVPTMSHAVCIPSGMPRYPKLTDILGVSITEEHTYASHSVTIMDDAFINGVEGVKVIVNGKLTVIGELFINSTEGPQMEGRKNGIIEVKSGGKIRIE